MHLFVLLFLLKHFLAKMQSGHQAGWAFILAQSGHCPVPILNVFKLKKHNLKILQMSHDVTDCDFALDCHFTYPDGLHLFPCWDLRNQIPSNNCPKPRSAIWSQQLLGEGHKHLPARSHPCSPLDQHFQPFPNRQRFCTGFSSVHWYFPA